MVQIPYGDIGSGATAPGTPLGDMLGAAGDFVCDMYENYPDWSIGDPTGFGSIARGIWDNLCRPQRGDPPFPQLPPPGGQCECQLYEVSGSFALFGPSQPWSATLRGPIGQARLYGLAGGNLAFGFYHQNNACNGWQVFNIVSNFTAEDWKEGRVSATLTSISPVGGQPDLCGDRPPIYPPSIPTAPELERETPINFSPTVVIPVGFVYIRPNIDIDVDARANIDVGVDVNLDVGVNFNFNLGGVNISFGGGGGSPTPPLPPADPRPNPPVAPNPPLAPGTDIVLDELDEIQNLLEDIKDCACQYEGTLRTTQYNIANSRTVSTPPRTIGATIELTQIPSNGSGQWGGENAPDVEYAGWGWFKYEDDGLSERLPVDAKNKAFIPPRPGAVGFAYTLKVGYLGILRVHYLESVGA